MKLRGSVPKDLQDLQGMGAKSQSRQQLLNKPYNPVYLTTVSISE